MAVASAAVAAARCLLQRGTSFRSGVPGRPPVVLPALLLTQARRHFTVDADAVSGAASAAAATTSSAQPLPRPGIAVNCTFGFRASGPAGEHGLAEAFERAVGSNGPMINALPLADPEKLELDALFKQATRGDAGSQSLPTDTTAQRRSEHAAWVQLRGTPVESAMRNYVAKSNALYRDLLQVQLHSRPSSSSGGGGTEDGRSAEEEALLQRLWSEDERGSIELEDVLQMIERRYRYCPHAGFQNGELYNSAGENEKSARVLAWAVQQQLGTKDTLRCFGRFFRQLEPGGADHPNIRQLLQHGIRAVRFEHHPLTPRGMDDDDEDDS